MRIELISTGDEVITGSIDDTNASFLSRELIETGLQVNRRHTTGDSLEELIAVFQEVSERDAVVIVTGGLGPTNDDLTTEAAARVAKVPLELNEQWLERMELWFKNRGRTMSQTNIKQAMLPQGALAINNPNGTACGFVLKINRALFIFCPGVPKELKAMWESYIKEMVLSFTKGTAPRTHLIRLFLMGIGESNMAERLAQLHLPDTITLGDRAIYPLIELKIIGHNASDQDMFHSLDEVMSVVAPYYVCRDNYSLIDSLAQRDIRFEPVNAVDGLCRGWFLIHLQSLFSDFVTCTVLNTGGDNAEQSTLIPEHTLLEHIPKENRMTLMPIAYDEEAKQQVEHMIADKPEYQMLKSTYLFHYILNFDLKFSEQGRPAQIKGRYLIGFKDSIYHSSSYTRNRDFLAQLSNIEIYKTVVKEPLIVPEDCAIVILSQEDSRIQARA